MESRPKKDIDSERRGFDTSVLKDITAEANHGARELQDSTTKFDISKESAAKSSKRALNEPSTLKSGIEDTEKITESFETPESIFG